MDTTLLKHYKCIRNIKSDYLSCIQKNEVVYLEVLMPPRFADFFGLAYIVDFSFETGVINFRTIDSYFLKDLTLMMIRQNDDDVLFLPLGYTYEP